MSTATTALSQSEIETLRTSITGIIILPGDDGYDDARRVQIFTYDHRPALIVRVSNAADVAESIRFARANGLQIAVRSGGHSFAGYGGADDALVIDLSAMRSIDIDPKTRIARVQAGATAQEIADAGQPHGLALTTGDAGSVGIGGLIVGGGIGYMARSRGLTVDHLRSATVVTADGSILTASESENADLFWAIRGGGGNFGVVTELEFEMGPDGMIYGGAIALPPTLDVVRGFVEYGSQAPDGLTMIGALMYVPPAPFIPEEKIGTPAFIVLACHVGDPEEGARALQPIRDLAEPIADVLGPMPYPGMFMFTEVVTHPFGDSSRSLLADEIPDDVLEAMIAHQPKGPSPISMVQIRPLGGAMSRVANDATAFPHRDKRFAVAAIGAWMDPTDDPQKHIDWTNGLMEQIQHIRVGSYVNFLSREGEERIADSYTGNMPRLQEVKAKYDPENVFNVNQNIKPKP